MNTSTETAPFTIDVVSDVVCPWCFIGKRRLERALAMRPDLPVDLRFNPYFLNPWVPREGISREQYLITKFGSVERYAAMSGRMVAAGAAEGINFAFDKLTWQANTLDCHRLLLWARQAGVQPAVKERLMAMYFEEGANLSDPEVLVRAAGDCGMDGDRVREKLAGDADAEIVERAAKSAADAGIDGVPCFILGGVFAVSGAQEPAYLADAIDRARAELAKRASAA